MRYEIIPEAHIVWDINPLDHALMTNIFEPNIKKIFFREDFFITLDVNGKILLWGHDLKEEPIPYMEGVKDLKCMTSQYPKVQFYFLTNEMNLFRMDYVILSLDKNKMGMFDIPLLRKPEIETSEISLIDYGMNHVIVLTKGGDLYGSGKNNYGQLGSAQSPSDMEKIIGWWDRKIDIPEQIVDIKCGWNHSVALTENYSVYAWGSNTNKQLGLESDHYSTPQKLNVPPIISICCYDDFTILLSIDGTIYSYGDRDS